MAYRPTSNKTHVGQYVFVNFNDRHDAVTAFLRKSIATAVRIQIPLLGVPHWRRREPRLHSSQNNSYTFG